jgi:hypothetical protein
MSCRHSAPSVRSARGAGEAIGVEPAAGQVAIKRAKPRCRRCGKPRGHAAVARSQRGLVHRRGARGLYQCTCSRSWSWDTAAGAPRGFCRRALRCDRGARAAAILAYNRGPRQSAGRLDGNSPSPSPAAPPGSAGPLCAPSWARGGGPAARPPPSAPRAATSQGHGCASARPLRRRCRRRAAAPLPRRCPCAKLRWARSSASLDARDWRPATAAFPVEHPRRALLAPRHNLPCRIHHRQCHLLSQPPFSRGR